MSTQQTPGAGYTMPTPDQLPKLRLVTPLFPGMKRDAITADTLCLCTGYAESDRGTSVCGSSQCS